jgi:outer membrane protein
VISSKQTLTTKILLLRETTGESYDAAELAAPGDDMPLLVPEPQDGEKWVQSALAGNLDLAYSRISLDLATHDLGTYKTERWPSLTVGASYSNQNQYENFNATGAPRNSWDKNVSVGITVPIFSGGKVSSDIRTGVYNQRAARENVELNTRQTESSARDTYLSVQSSISLVQANKQALESQRLALQATEAGFQVGTRTNIDVLNARRTLYSTEVSYAQSRYNYLQYIIKLKQVVGALNRTDLEQINSWLVK